MRYHLPCEAAIFDMDGLLIDSEPLWERAEEEVLGELGVDLRCRDRLPETTGVRIDQVVAMWYAVSPWRGPSCEAVTEQISARTLALIQAARPLMPGVHHALDLCAAQGLKIGLASASPLAMIEQVLTLFALRDRFAFLASADTLPLSKPHPQVYLNAAAGLGIDPQRCVALEDSLTGMVAVKAARMRAIVVPAAAQRTDPRWVLAEVRLSQLCALRAADLHG
ncbi:hexitol phosphatase HxpB [Pantoea sp. 1.19]|uniref:hexitol phosphatase HxpB n=1 Tax=Pantoea sp. 1.19 TaxID=1925589 RepID=UPI000948D65D|nr:hexitol phosphatase HxpB [Pantoea sp. 1.19]